MPRKRTSRIYTRSRGGAARYYGDFRDYADVGGGREPLVPKGAHSATTDRDVAQDIAAHRVRDLDARRRRKQIAGIANESTLGTFAVHHLEQKAIAGSVADHVLEATELYLQRALEYFGQDRELGSVSVADMQGWMRTLYAQSNGRGSTLSGAAVRKHLYAVSNLYRRAAAEGYVLAGYNPVAAMMDKPKTSASSEAEWLEGHELALLLEAALHYAPARKDGIKPALAAALIGTLVLTGAREAEVLGLGTDDVSFDRGTITFRPHTWRGLKTSPSRRTIRMWPQLRELLQPYVFGTAAAPGPLLFPSPRARRRDAMLTDLRPLLDALSSMCGWSVGDVRSKMLRHSYCAARLQTADRVLIPGGDPANPSSWQWIPISPFTVGRELGHGGDAMVKRVYGHVNLTGAAAPRSELVEFRADHHAAQLGERLIAIRASSGVGARRCSGVGTNGEPCALVTTRLSAHGLCIWHDPARSAEARAARPHAHAAPI
jgi:integrase